MSLTKAAEVKRLLNKYATKEYAKTAEWFFKTGPGEYGEGDKFIGVRVPTVRLVAKDSTSLSLAEVAVLLSSAIHEERLLALIILTLQYEKGTDKIKKEIFEFYLDNSHYINNWDLVDVSVHKIVGAYVWENPNKKTVLYRLVKSKNLWERRMSIVATFYFIARGELEETFVLASLLLSDKHDLIHKAVGWALREVGKKREDCLKDFLIEHYPDLPRTTLRYAIERFPSVDRQKYLRGEF